MEEGGLIPVQQRIKALARVARTRAQRQPDLSPPPSGAALMAQLPLWRESQRGMPNALIRSALFSVRDRTVARAYLKEAIVASLKNIHIRYTGEELRQDDASVLMQLLHLARTSPLGEVVTFTAGAMIAALDWTRNSSSYERLRACILRLTATLLHVQVDNEKTGYGSSLIRSFEYSTAGGEPLKLWRITLEPAIAALFGDSSYTRVLLDQRLRIKRNQLALYLHLYYSSHAQPYPQSVASLHALSGSDCKALYHFREILMRALDELRRVGFLRDWTLTKDDKVIVDRIPIPQMVEGA